MQKHILFSENNWNQCEWCSWCIYSTFLLQLKVIWIQTRLPWSQDNPFSKSLLSSLDGIHNPDFHVRNLKVYETHLRWSFCGRTGLKYDIGERLSALVTQGHGDMTSVFQQERMFLLWLDSPSVIEVLPSVLQAVCSHKLHSVYDEEDFLCHTPDKWLCPFKQRENIFHMVFENC